VALGRGGGIGPDDVAGQLEGRVAVEERQLRQLGGAGTGGGHEPGQ
jgi:hypothetical protein